MFPDERQAVSYRMYPSVIQQAEFTPDTATYLSMSQIPDKFLGYLMTLFELHVLYTVRMESLITSSM